MNYALLINGLDNAFPKEFGCECPRCARLERAANTSVSLVGLDDAGDTAFHALIDCGGGVSESLSNHPLLHGARARLDWVLFTHWHSDHSCELSRVCASWTRTRARRGQPFARIPIWCREGSAQWLARENGSAWRAFADPCVAPGFDDAGVALAPVPVDAPGLRITPITLHHSSADTSPADPPHRQPSCAGFVIETPARKAVLFWDMDITNTWITDPQTEAHYAALALASNADILCVDCNTWRIDQSASGRPASHAAFHSHLHFAPALAPRETLLMHLSGHEDAPGDGRGWLDAEWQSQAQRVWAERQMPGRVRVPAIGEVVALN